MEVHKKHILKKVQTGIYLKLLASDQKKRDLSQRMIKKIGMTIVKNPTDIYDKEIKNSDTKNNETFKFDLHGFSLNDANKKVRDLVFHCVNKNTNKYY